MKDWITHTIELQPDARTLQEHLNLRDFGKAMEVSSKMIQDLEELQAYINEKGIAMQDTVYNRKDGM